MKMYLMTSLFLLFSINASAKEGSMQSLVCTEVFNTDIHKSLLDLHDAFHIKHLQSVKELNAFLTDYIGDQRLVGYAETNGETHPVRLFTSTSSFIIPEMILLKDSFSIRMVFKDTVPFQRPRNIFKGRLEPYIEERDAEVVYQYTLLDNMGMHPTVIEDIIIEDLTLTVLTKQRPVDLQPQKEKYEQLKIKFNESGDVVFIEVTLPPFAQSKGLYQTKDRLLTARFLFDERTRDYVP